MPPDSAPHVLSLSEAIVYALENNPELAAQRQQHGIAAAAIVIARTYPFNPVFDTRVQSVRGPAAAGVTDPTPYEMAVLLELELRGQGKHRRCIAQAALSRTDWEIVNRETALAIRVAQAYRSVLYRGQKLALIEETVNLNQQVVDQVRKLVDAGKLGGADLLVARTEVDDARSQLAPARTNLATAQAELRRALGWVGPLPELMGMLEMPQCPLDHAALESAGLEQRADLHARQAVVDEAAARLGLTRADRYGNPSIGPAYSINETSVQFIGVQASIPLPVFNTKKGEIQQREAELNQAVSEMHQIEVQVQQDIDAALARLDTAAGGVQTYETEILPNLRSALDGLNKLIAQNDKNVDVLRIVDLYRKLLRAREGRLDGLWEAAQAQADLALAVGDPALAVGACPMPLGEHPAP
jgi:cobalt-zinc-cadmium efflux system outer membrane protein